MQGYSSNTSNVWAVDHEQNLKESLARAIHRRQVIANRAGCSYSTQAEGLTKAGFMEGPVNSAPVVTRATVAIKGLQ